MELERELGCSSGFYKSRRLYFGNYLYVLAIEKSGNHPSFSIYRPNTGASSQQMLREQLWERYERIHPLQAEEEWTEKYTNSLEVCVHGTDCLRGASCTVESIL